MSSSSSLAAPRPPSIPSVRAESGRHPRHALLIWVRNGAARVQIDEESFRIADAEGLWIPATGWDRRVITTEPGTVAFPLWPPPSVGAEAPKEPTRFAVPAVWQDWLIQHFNLMVTPLAGHGYAQGRMAELLRPTAAQPPVPPRDEGAQRSTDSLSALEPPLMPQAAGARTVAEELLRDPAIGLTVEEWAAGVLSSPRTLRRDFLAGTGLTFEQWRLRCRLGAALEFLAAGYGVDQVAARAGFASRNGFTRAFKQQFGSTPHEFARELSARGVLGSASRRVTAARQADALATMVGVGEGHVPPAAPGRIPATRTPPHASDIHVLSWVYRGSGYLDIDGRRCERGRGTATWIPAGVEHVTGLRENSVSLPLGDVSPADLHLDEPLQAQFPSAWDDYLMFCSVSARSLLRPDGYDPTHILDLFREQLAAQRARSAPMPTDRRAHAAATEFLRTVGTGGGPASQDLPAEVHRAFREETGMTFASWRYAARMRIARDLLAGGSKPSAVARRVGYAHLPNFSSAFSRFHGMSAREYQEREAQRP
jgi:AraC-like DNA-binding protein/mannose-6-phosphate isomerase-like protein (cupin superfamily)